MTPKELYELRDKPCNNPENEIYRQKCQWGTGDKTLEDIQDKNLHIIRAGEKAWKQFKMACVGVAGLGLWIAFKSCNAHGAETPSENNQKIELTLDP